MRRRVLRLLGLRSAVSIAAETDHFEPTLIDVGASGRCRRDAARALSCAACVDTEWFEFERFELVVSQGPVPCAPLQLRLRPRISRPGGVERAPGRTERATTVSSGVDPRD